MGYRIQYGMGKGERLSLKKKRRILPWVAGVAVVGLLVVAYLLPQARRTVYEHILPGDGKVTAEALQNLAVDLSEGEKLSEAVTAFCEYILSESGR